MEVNVSYHAEIRLQEYITINGRTSRVHYTGGYAYTSWPKEGKTVSIQVHRLLMELALDRLLEPGEHVHHKDGNRLNNAIENLEVVNGSEHNREHTTLRNLKHDPDNFICVLCGRTDKPHKAFGWCVLCWTKNRRRKKITNPCRRCGTKIDTRSVINGLCVHCCKAMWTRCKLCQRSKESLPKGCLPINGKGLCRVCSNRIQRQAKRAAQG